MKLVKDANGNVIAYGPNDDNYEPTVPAGYCIEIVDDYTPTTPVKTNNQLLAETDTWMDRISEDTVVGLIAKGTMSKSDYDPIVITRINYRRNLRGQPPI